MFNILIDEQIVSRIFVSVGILLGTFIVSVIVKKAIDMVFKEVRRAIISEHFIAKTKAARTLLKNILDVFLFGIAVLMILVQWGVDIGPILTGAGILGLAFSFGAQSLVKDLISGFFILLEGQFIEGDEVIINDDTKGRVYRMTLRLTILIDKDESLIYLPNSQIKKVVKFKTRSM